MAEPRFAAPRRPRSWLRRRSLRAKLTLIATLVFAAGLAAGAVLLVVALTRSLTAGVDQPARQTARSVAALVDSGEALPEPLPVGNGNTVAVQVLTAGEQVVAASAGGDHLVPLLTPAEIARVRAGDVLAVPGARAGVSGPLRVVGVRAGAGNGSMTVVVAVGAGPVDEGERALTIALGVGAPILLVLLALVSWYVVGRALRPVEALRRGAEDITGSGGSRRLPLPESRDEVGRLALTLNDMLARLDASSAQQRSFVSDAAHELRSPLASLRTQLEVARRLGGRAEWDATAAGALLDVERLSRLVDDLLLLARLDERPGARLRRTAVDCGALADSVASGYAGSRVAVRVTSPVPTASSVHGDAEALRRVLANLIDNAVIHAAALVEISVVRDGAWVLIRVADDGPGIPASERARVFDRFTRRDDSRSRLAGGAGLGLPIVRELVRSHGGTVELTDARAGESPPGLAATVSLPAR